MKTSIIISLVSILLSSCSSSIYQVTQFKYTGELEGESPNFVDHGDITIDYLFWGEGGRLSFTVINHSDKPVMLDFSQSSLIINGKNYPYARGRSVTRFESISESDQSNQVVTSGTAKTQYDENYVFIAPDSEMYFHKMWLNSPRVTSEPLKSTESKEIDMPQKLAEYSFRNYLTFSSEGETFIVDDHFTTESISLMGLTAFNQFRSQPGNELSSYYCVYEPDSSAPFIGFILFTTVFLGVILAT